MSFKIVCAACNTQIGHGEVADAEQLGIEHAPHCTATEEEHAKALTDIKFRNIVQGLGL
ncbi:MAG: hypothetical protein KDE19_02595 [Caldilineaceae bacterium]|nr:hypothetical protein [Caldilineaceae bacterium]